MYETQRWLLRDSLCVYFSGDFSGGKMLELMAVIWVCPYCALIYLSLPEPKQEWIWLWGADPFLGLAVVSQDLYLLPACSAELVRLRYHCSKPLCSPLWCEALRCSLLRDVYRQPKRGTFERGALLILRFWGPKSREMLSNGKCLLRLCLEEVWFGGGIMACDEQELF